MRELGYIEGENLVIEYSFAESKAERLPTMVAELIEQKVDILVVSGTQPVRAAQKATSAIPIVIGTVNDPVGSGFVQSLSRPGGNITGLSNLTTDLSPKLLEMLRSMGPKLSRVAIMVNPTNQSHVAIARSIEAAAQKVDLQSVRAAATNPEEIEQAFATISAESVGGVILDPAV